MNIKKIIKNIYDILESLRQSGTSTLLKKIRKDNDIYIMVSNKKIKHILFGEDSNVLTMNDDITKVIGKDPKPILIDTDVLMALLPEIENKIDILEKSNKQKEELIDSIELKIKNYRNKSLRVIDRIKTPPDYMRR